ncbi:hypothetical protein G6011_11538 [Alternaria panax]|uniref:Uncharacterized protein n=1 Tax=Alternaria panax TaxID=48097 RepID=A0AAD4NSG5_9PLEO|nr:hypothetical protein G6011_11538 [Alternaria panax]
MSSKAVIESLKQGNAVEMGMLQELKDGASSFFDGILNECFNRSDILSELTEKLQLETSAAPVPKISAEQKDTVQKLIRRATFCCEQAMSINSGKQKKEIEEAMTAFEAEGRILQLSLKHAELHQEIFIARSNVFRSLNVDLATSPDLVELQTNEGDLIDEAFRYCTAEIGDSGNGRK